MAEYYEEKLSKQCENLKEYQDAINEILDRLENNTFKNEIELLIDYQFEIQMYGHFGFVVGLKINVIHLYNFPKQNQKS